MRAGKALLRWSDTDSVSVRSGMLNMLSSALYCAISRGPYGYVERQLWFRLRAALYGAVVARTADTISAYG